MCIPYENSYEFVVKQNSDSETPVKKQSMSHKGQKGKKLPNIFQLMGSKQIPGISSMTVGNLNEENVSFKSRFDSNVVASQVQHVSLH